MTTLGLGQVAIACAAAACFLQFVIPLMNTSNQAIWQAKVPPEIQGKVFSARLLIAQIAAPLSMLISGPLADFVFGPAMCRTADWRYYWDRFSALGWAPGCR